MTQRQFPRGQLQFPDGPPDRTGKQGGDAHDHQQGSEQHTKDRGAAAEDADALGQHEKGIAFVVGADQLRCQANRPVVVGIGFR